MKNPVIYYINIYFYHLYFCNYSGEILATGEDSWKYIIIKKHIYYIFNIFCNSMYCVSLLFQCFKYLMHKMAYLKELQCKKLYHFYYLYVVNIKLISNYYYFFNTPQLLRGVRFFYCSLEKLPTKQ